MESMIQVRLRLQVQRDSSEPCLRLALVHAACPMISEFAKEVSRDMQQIYACVIGWAPQAASCGYHDWMQIGILPATAAARLAMQNAATYSCRGNMEAAVRWLLTQTSSRALTRGVDVEEDSDDEEGGEGGEVR
jgi:hypothetical protein